MALSADEMGHILVALMNKFAPGQEVDLTEGDLDAIHGLFPGKRTYLRTDSNNWGGLRLSLVGEADDALAQVEAGG